MSNDKKISQFPGRRSAALASAVSVVANNPALGGNQGSFKRPPCGTCLSWKKMVVPGGALDQGVCMFGPPVAYPIMNEQGQVIGQALTRATVKADHEGCDQHDDGTDEEDGPGGGEEVGRIVSTG